MTIKYDGHHCHAIGCRTPTPPVYLMCGWHWHQVPKQLQRNVWEHYRTGQCDDKRPSKEWFKAANAAIKFVYEKTRPKGHQPKGVSMQLVLNFKEGSTAQDVAAQLRFQAALFDGVEPKKAASREITDAPTGAKRGRKPQAAPEETFDLDASDTAEDTQEDFDIGDGEEAEAEPEITKGDILNQLRIFSTKTKGGSKEKAMAAIKKFAKSGKLGEVKKADYPKLMKLIGG